MALHVSTSAKYTLLLGSFLTANDRSDRRNLDIPDKILVKDSIPKKQFPIIGNHSFFSATTAIFQLLQQIVCFQ